MSNTNNQKTENLRNKKIYLMTVSASGKTTFTKQYPYYQHLRIIDFSAVASEKTRQQAKLESLKAAKPVRNNIFISLFNKIRWMKRRLFKFMKNMNASKSSRLPYTGKTYHEEIISYIRATPGPIVVLGRMDLPNPEQYPDITIGAVLIPEAEHKRNCSERKKQLPHGSWTDFDEVRELREKLQVYVKQHSIQLYPSFETAIDGLLKDHE